MREYLYFPLGGNRLGPVRTILNLWLVFLLSGIWHGASWNFVIWGAFHGFFISLNKTGNYLRLKPWPSMLAIPVTFVCLMVSWVFFRAESTGDAITIITRTFTTGWQDPAFPLLALALVAAVWLYQFLYESGLRSWMELSTVRVFLVVLMILYLCIVPGSGGQAFIYFQF